MPSQIGTLGTIPTLTMGQRVYTDLTNIIQLFGACTTGAAVNASFRKGNGTAGYQVTSGKTLNLSAIRSLSLGAAENAYSGQLCYSDNDVGTGTATAFVNQVYFTGSALGAQFGNRITGSISPYCEESIDFNIPSLKYAGVVTLGSNVWQFRTVGYEA